MRDNSEYFRALRIGRRGISKYNIEGVNNITFNGQVIDLNNYKRFDRRVRMEWSELLVEYMSVRVVAESYGTLIKVLEKGGVVESPREGMSKEVLGELEVLKGNIVSIKKMYRRETMKHSLTREVKSKSYLGFLLLQKLISNTSKPYLEKLRSGEDTYHIVVRDDKNKHDIITTIPEMSVVEEIYNPIKLDLGEEEEKVEINLYKKAYKEIFGVDVKDELQDDGDKLVFSYCEALKDLEIVLDSPILNGNGRGLLGTMLSKLEGYFDLEGYIKGNVEQGVEEDVLGITKGVITLTEKEQMMSKDTEEVLEELKIELNQDVKEEVDTKSEVKEVCQEDTGLNFKAMDKFYSLLSMIDKRSPSKEMYEILKKGGVTKEVITRFMNCKNIEYFDYLEIESLVEDYLEKGKL